MGSGAFEGAWKEVVFYTGIPETDEEIVNRIGDADCVLVSYNTQIRRNVIEACRYQYIGMCCTSIASLARMWISPPHVSGG